MPNGMGEGFRALAFFQHGGCLKSQNAGFWGRAPDQLAAPSAHLPVHFWAKSHKIKVIKRKAYGFHDDEYFALKVKQAFAA